MQRGLQTFGWLLAACLVVGCGARGPVPTYPTSGQVLYAGKPAVGVKVYLLPTSAPMVPQIPQNPHGVTGSDGRFTLSTYGDGDGAAEGGYQVVLLWPTVSEDSEESDFDRFLGWHDAVHSKLTAQITSGDNLLPPFNLPAVTRPPDAAEGVPGRN